MVQLMIVPLQTASLQLTVSAVIFEQLIVIPAPASYTDIFCTFDILNVN